MTGPSKEELYNNVRHFAVRTPLETSEALNEQIGATVLFKPENRQKSHAFKQRGAGNKMQALHAQGVTEVISASAGNHAQGVALAAEALGMTACIVVPETAPQPKIDALKQTQQNMKRRGRGVLELVLYGQNFPEAMDYSLKIAEDRELVHPFDDPDVIAGQGTIGHEILDEAPGLDAILVQVGGLGLAAGISAAIKSRSPKAQVITVEPEGTPTFYKALEAGRPVDLANVDTFADGLAVRRVGDLPFEIASKLIDGAMLVTNSEIKQGMRTAWHLLGERLEPAGAVGLGALAKAVDLHHLQNKQIAVINTGGNVSDQVFENVLNDN